jgi:anaerobic magnesium-protoporphyrin IX monomethyl ester cyclase
MRVVLLNPPGDKIYIRSYYCGSTSKSNYLFHPLDLLVLSGRLYGLHEMTIIDAIAQRLDEKETLKRIVEYKAEAVICMVSIVSWKTDLAFLDLLKNSMPSLIIIANGDVFFDDPAAKLKEHRCIDAIIFDFISSNVVHYLKNEEDKISNMMYRKDGGIVFKGPAVKEVGEVFSIPVPRHELFLNKNYTFPFAKRVPFATVLTNFGCPFRCSFCIANTFGFKYRKAV